MIDNLDLVTRYNGKILTLKNPAYRQGCEVLVPLYDYFLNLSISLLILSTLLSALTLLNQSPIGSYPKAK